MITYYIIEQIISYNICKNSEATIIILTGQMRKPGNSERGRKQPTPVTAWFRSSPAFPRGPPPLLVGTRAAQLLTHVVPLGGDQAWRGRRIKRISRKKRQ